MPIKIGPNVFVVPPPTAMRSFALQQRVLPVVSRVVNLVAGLLRLEGGPTKLGDIDVAKVLPVAMPALGQVFADMAPGELEAITRELLKDASADRTPLFATTGGQDFFDGLLAGRSMDTWRLLWHALEVWYPDFFGLVRGLVARPAAVEAPSAASST